MNGLITTREYQQNFINTFAPELNRVSNTSHKEKGGGGSVSTPTRSRSSSGGGSKQKGGQRSSGGGSRPVPPTPPKPRYSDPDFEPRPKGLKSYPISNYESDSRKLTVGPLSIPAHPPTRYRGPLNRPLYEKVKEESARDKLERVERERLAKKKKEALEELTLFGKNLPLSGVDQINLKLPNGGNPFRTPFFVRTQSRF